MTSDSLMMSSADPFVSQDLSLLTPGLRMSLRICPFPQVTAPTWGTGAVDLLIMWAIPNNYSSCLLKKSRRRLLYVFRFMWRLTRWRAVCMEACISVRRRKSVRPRAAEEPVYTMCVLWTRTTICCILWKYHILGKTQSDKAAAIPGVARSQDTAFSYNSAVMQGRDYCSPVKIEDKTDQGAKNPRHKRRQR